MICDVNQPLPGVQANLAASGKNTMPQADVEVKVGAPPEFRVQGGKNGQIGSDTGAVQKVFSPHH